MGEQAPKVGGKPAKRCYVCQQFKPLAEFYRNRTAPDGLTPECKTCVKAQRRAAYAQGDGRYKRAHMRAMSRLSKLHPEQFRALLDEELAREDAARPGPLPSKDPSR